MTHDPHRDDGLGPPTRIDSEAFEDPVEARCPLCGEDVHLNDSSMRGDHGLAHAGCVLSATPPRS